jgi:signal transduction histidine kinase
MTNPIRILHLEDNRSDVELVSELLAAEGLSCKIVWVENRESYLTALKQGEVDLILSDNSLPSFDGMAALSLARKNLPETPFIFVSGTIGEEAAIESIKSGATDYVLKERLSRLATSVRRALKEVEEQRERRKLESIVVKSEKMAAMGQLAAGVAHELNNPLTGLLGFVQLLSQSKGLSPQQLKDLESIEIQGHRCRDIIQNLLQFCRKKEPRKEAVQIGQVVDSVLRLIQYDFSTSGIVIEKNVPVSLPALFGDASQLQQVFLNLMLNAKDAMEGRRPARLGIQVEAKNQSLIVCITDSGCGISKENLEKIFDLFFTTKPPGKGTGLGLSIVYEIIQEHGGIIDVQSQEGAGTAFTIKLPASNSISAPQNGDLQVG